MLTAFFIYTEKNLETLAPIGIIIALVLFVFGGFDEPISSNGQTLVKIIHQSRTRPTKRAPDAGDSAHIPSSFLRLIIFLVGRLRRPPPQRR